MANVRELLFPLFAYGLSFEQANAPEQAQDSYEQVRGEISALLEWLQAAAQGQGMGASDAKNAGFAAVAWLDETIRKHPTWAHRNQWQNTPLLIEDYQPQQAGETFFEHLERLSSAQKELRDIYYLCLALGFAGRYSPDIEAIRKLVPVSPPEPPEPILLPGEHGQALDNSALPPHNIRELLFPLFAYGLSFEQANVPGQAQDSYEQVLRKISAWLKELQAAAQSQGMGASDARNAGIAAVAWLDETIRKHPTWARFNTWQKAPLLFRYYKTQKQKADETFFEHLERLNSAQKALRDIYYLCLALGFTGRYSRDIEAIHKLVEPRAVSPTPPVDKAVSPTLPVDKAVSPTQVKDEPGPGNIIPHVRFSLLEWIKKLIQRPLIQLQSISQHVVSFGKKGINPIQRRLMPLQGALIQRLRTHRLLKAGLALLVVVTLELFVLWWFRPPQQFQLTVRKVGDGGRITLSTSAGPDRICDPDCSKATYAYPKGTVVTLKATDDSSSTFQEWTEAPDCAQGITLTANKTCTAIFTSLPTRASDKETAILPPVLQPCTRISNILSQNSHVAKEIIQSIGKHRKDVLTVNDALRIISSSFCDILGVIVPFQSDSKKDFALMVSLDKAGPNPIYTDGENLLVRVATPTKFESYIYIDYYTVSDQVVHLFPNPRFPVNSFVPHSDFTKLALIREPFGVELVTVIASKTPLFTLPRFGVEQAQSYIQALQQVWPKDGSTSEIATAFYFITTQEQ